MIAYYTLLFYFLRVVFAYWHEFGIEQITPFIPFGNLYNYLYGYSTFGQIMQKWYNATRLDYYGMYLGFKPALFIRSPYLVREFLDRDFMYFSKRTINWKQERCPIMVNMYSKSGCDWREDREQMTPVFAPDNLQDMLLTMSNVNPALERYLDFKCEDRMARLNVHRLIERHLHNVIGKLVYGLRINTFAMPNESYRRFANQALKPSVKSHFRFLRNYVLPEWMFSWFNVKSLDKKTENFFISLAKHSLNMRENRIEHFNDYMNLLVKLRNQGYVRPNELELDIPLTLLDGKLLKF